MQETQATVWADLGCGNGLFTKALAELLKEGSTVYAIDKDAQSLEIVTVRQEIRLIKKIADFGRAELQLSAMDGLLMANSLHYLKNKRSFIDKASLWLKDGGSFLLIEYDTEKGNAWVPYPLSFQKAVELFKSCGYNNIKKISEHSSVYNRAGMYVALIKH